MAMAGLYRRVLPSPPLPAIDFASSKGKMAIASLFLIVHYSDVVCLETYKVLESHQSSKLSISGTVKVVISCFQKLRVSFDLDQFSEDLDPFVTYIAVNYMDRFISAKKFVNQEKPWIVGLVMISCLFLSVKRINSDLVVPDSQMDGEYSIPATANCKSIREFDKALTRVSFGFKSVDETTKICSSDSIKHVTKPLLCIRTANDPIAPARGIIYEDIKENSNCVFDSYT